MTRLRIVGLFLLLIGALSRASVQSPAIPADLDSFIGKSRDLLKAGDFDGLRKLGDSPATLSWLGQRSGRTRSSWNLDALAFDRSGKEFVAVFHEFHTCESTGDHVHKLIHRADGWRFGAEIAETDTLGFRVRDHHVALQYDVAKSECRIQDDVTVERVAAGSPVCLLRLSDDMRLDGASLGRAPLLARNVPGVILFDAPSERTFKIRLNYHGTVNHPGSDYILPTEAVLVSYWYPHIARLPAKLGVTATAPEGWTVIGQGELVKREGNSFTYRNEIPTCVFSLDAAPYIITSRTVDGRKLSACLINADEGKSNRSIDQLAKALAFFEKSFGKFPYTHYELVETNAPFGGALEAYSFSTYARGTMPGAVPHEVSHTWWGGIVPNPYTRTLWNESFANYSDGLFRRQTGSSPTAKALTGAHQAPRYGRDAAQFYAVPISKAFDTENPSHAGVGYGKGSVVLGMLEDLIGTQKMIASMRRYVQDHREGEEGSWSEFAVAVRKTTGENLQWFFDQWTNRPGEPVLMLDKAEVKAESGKWIVKADVVQQGVPYRLMIPVRVEFASGAARNEKVSVTGARTPIKLTLDRKPTTLTLDPDGNILMAGAKLPDDTANPFRASFE